MISSVNYYSERHVPIPFYDWCNFLVLPSKDVYVKNEMHSEQL